MKRDYHTLTDKKEALFQDIGYIELFKEFISLFSTQVTAALCTFGIFFTNFLL